MVLLGRGLLAVGRVAFRRPMIVRHLQYDAFVDRHIGPRRLEQQQMLDFIGYKVRGLIFHY